MDITRTRELFDSKAFEAAFHTDLPLGSFCGRDGTLFRLWAPTAENVVLRLYPAGHGGRPKEILHPERGENGTWQCATSRNLDGWYYDYAVTVDGKLHETNDPWAKSCGLNGKRSMVLDLTRTDPPNWEQDEAPALTPEQIIYELHIRDFSWDTAGGFESADRGLFRALTKTGTTLNGDGHHATGLDYLKRLGITHIQLMPIYDYGSVDEKHPEDTYNWGYDPMNHNVPEGSYSSDPYRGEVRVRELKDMVAALHKNGFRVIMDVVYNHTYNLDCGLFQTVPWYFYRQTPTGASSNGSGCGNDLATERSMCARYILESVLYWAEEYHMDGFRFDLMGLMDRTLMNRIRQALDARYGVGEKLVYGEPWRAGQTHARLGTVLCGKEDLPYIDPGIGAFNDNTRDAVKGNVMQEASVGFVNGGTLRADALRKGVIGWTASQIPNRNIPYLSCHDDWTLWDKLVYTMDPNRQFLGSNPELRKASRLAAAMLFCCQGRPFFLAGEEFARTKGGIKNSYCSSSEINRLDWARAWENRFLVDYYRGLIALRQQLPAFTDKSAEAGKRLLWAKDFGPNCAGVCLDNRDGTRWPRLLAVFNCSDVPCSLPLPEGRWQLLCDGDSSFRWQQNVPLSERCTLQPGTALILGLIMESYGS